VATVVGVRFSSLAPQKKNRHRMVSVLFLSYSIERRIELKMGQSGGLFRQPVQKLVATLICGTAANAAILLSRPPIPRITFRHLSQAQRRIEIKMQLAGGKLPNQCKHWFAPQFAAQPQMQRFSSPARQFAGSPFCIFPKRSSIESKLKRNRPVIAWGCSSPSV